MCVRTTGARIRHILIMAPVVRTLKPVVRTLPAMKGPSKSWCEDQKCDKARFENKNKFERTERKKKFVVAPEVGLVKNFTLVPELGSQSLSLRS
jgi:hypothetical protein